VGPRAGFERGCEEKNSQPLPGLEPPIIQLVSQRYTAELSRLLFRPLCYFNVLSASCPYHEVEIRMKEVLPGVQLQNVT
jgi:hypothetical protein